MEKDEKLIEAARSGDLKKVRRFLKRGADVNARGEKDETPLYLAAKNGYTEITALLLDNGADVNARGGGGWTPLYWPANKGYTEIVALLLDRGADVNVRDNVGETLLNWAVGDRRTEIAALLLDNGADVNARSRGWTPLYLAAGHGNTEIVELLLDRGADVNARNTSGETPLHWAGQNGNTEIVELLLDRGADVNARKNSGGTLLKWAARCGKTETARLLLDRGADVNARDNDGWTALYWATKEGHIETGELLRKHGGKKGDENKAIKEATRSPLPLGSTGESAHYDEDIAFCQAEPISRKRMDLLWLDPPTLAQVGESFNSQSTASFKYEYDSGIREHEISKEDYQWAKQVESIVDKAFSKGQLGFLEESIKLYKEALGLSPGCDLFLMSIGTCYGMLGDRDRAMQYLNRAVQISPDNSRIRENLEAARRAF